MVPNHQAVSYLGQNHQKHQRKCGVAGSENLAKLDPNFGPNWTPKLLAPPDIFHVALVDLMKCTKRFSRLKWVLARRTCRDERQVARVQFSLIWKQNLQIRLVPPQHQQG